MKFKFIKRVVAVALSAITLFTMIPTMSITASAATDDLNTNLKINLTYETANEIDTSKSWFNPNWFYYTYHSPEYNKNWNNFFVKMKANGKYVYCLNPGLTEPVAGTTKLSDWKRVPEDGNFGKSAKASFNKVLYYCDGGTRFNDANYKWAYSDSGNSTKRTMKEWMDFYIDKWNTYYNAHPTTMKYQGNTKVAETISPKNNKKENAYYALTHIILSRCYVGWGNDEYTAMNEYVPKGYLDAAKDLYNCLKSAPSAPQLALYYLPAKDNKHQTVLFQYPIKKLQVEKYDAITGTPVQGVKFGIYKTENDAKADKNKVATLTTGSNGIAAYKGSDGKYIEVPFAQDYYARELSVPKYYKLDTTPKKIGTDTGKTESGVSIYNAKFYDSPYIKLQLVKSSSNPDVSDDNKCYSLKGAKYNIYTDKNCKNLFSYITTDENGYGRYGTGDATNTDINTANSGRGIPLKKDVTYYCKEVEAPEGYKPDNTLYKFVDSGVTDSDGVKIYRAVDNATGKKQPSDEPLMDPVYIFIKKVNTATGSADQDLKEAEFTVEYFDGQYNSNEEIKIAKAQPKRTWVFKTDDNGICRYADLYKVSGGELYKDLSGTPKLPHGSLRIQETKAPSSGKYFINNQIIVKPTTYFFATIEDQTPKNLAIVNEVPITTTGLIVQKKADDGKVEGIWFKVTGSDGSETFAETNSTGTASFPDLKANDSAGKTITYTVTELGVKNSDGTYSIPKRYKESVTAPETQTITLNTDSSKNVLTFTNHLRVGSIRIKKTATDGVTTGLWYGLTDSLGNTYDAVQSKECSLPGYDGLGYAYFNNLPLYDDNGNAIKYTVKELGFKANFGQTVYDSVTYTVNKENCVEYNGEYYEGINNATFLGADGKLYKSRYSGSTDAYSDIVLANATATNYTEKDKTVIQRYAIGNSLAVDTVKKYPERYDVRCDGAVNTHDATYIDYYINGLEITLPETMSVLTFENKTQETDLKVVKKSSDGVVKDFYFEVFDDEGTSCGILKTDSTGKATYSYQIGNKLPACKALETTAAFVPIKYSVKELGFKDADGNYYLPEYYTKEATYSPATVQATKDSTATLTITATNHKKQGKIVVSKSSDDDVINGFWFKVTSAQGYEQLIQTNSEGIAQTGNVDVITSDGTWIDYTVAELGLKQSDGSYKIPDRYNKPDNQTVNFAEFAEDFEENKDVVQALYVYFNNYLKRSNLEIVKQSGDNFIEGLSFKITSEYNTEGYIVTTNANGVAICKELPVYNTDNDKIVYTIEELGVEQEDGSFKIPSRYKKPADISLTLNYDEFGVDKLSLSTLASNNTKTLSFTNKDSDEKIVTDSEFRIYNAKTNSELFTYSPTAGVYSVGVGGSYKQNTIKTDSGGKLSIYQIPVGEYYLLETRKDSNSNVFINRMDFVVDSEITEKDSTIVVPTTMTTVTNNLQMKLQLIKTSSNELITDGNSNYSLNGAVYNIYKDKECRNYFGYIVTDADGYGCYKKAESGDVNNNISEVDVAKGKDSGASIEIKDDTTYYCREAKAPKGYKLDTETVYKFVDTTLTSNSGAKILRAQPIDKDGNVISTSGVFDSPVTAPPIYVQKRNAVTGETTNAGLQNAVFEVKFYTQTIDKDYDVDTSKDEAAPTLNESNLARTWYFKTDRNGYTHITNDENYLVNDSEFNSQSVYVDEDNNVALPIGSIVVTEVKAPSGYTRTPVVFYRNISQEVAEDVSSTGTPIIVEVDENPSTGYVGISKMNNSGKQVVGAVYGLYTDSTARTRVASLTTTSSTKDIFKDNNGNDYEAEIGKTYYIKEISAPTGYVLDKSVYPITPTLDNATLDKALIKKIYEDNEKGSIVVQKTSTDDHIENIWFGLTDSLGNTYDAVKTDKSGTAKFSSLLVYDEDGNKITYTVKELGYKASLGTNTYKDFTWTVTAAKCVEYNGDYYEGVDNATFTNPNGGFGYAKYHYGNAEEAKANALGYEVTLSDTPTQEVHFTSDDTLKIQKYIAGTITLSNEELAKYDLNCDGVVNVNDSKLLQSYLIGNIRLDEISDIVTQKFNNTAPETDMKVYKKTNDGVKADFYFEVYDQLGNSYGIIKTNASGVASFSEQIGTKLPCSFDVPNTSIVLPVRYSIRELGLKNANGDYYIPKYYGTPTYNNKNVYSPNYRGTFFTITATNHRKYGNIKVVKTSEDNVVKGFYFKITSDDGYEKYIYTNSDGIAETGNVEVQKADGTFINYTIEELGIKQADGTYAMPERYVKPKNQTVTFKDVSATRYVKYNSETKVYEDIVVTKSGNFENNLKKANLQVVKTSGDNVINGFAFSVTGSNGVSYGTKVTDSTGKALFTDLPVYGSNNKKIKYTVKELGVKQSDGTYEIPFRYVAPDDVITELAYDSTKTAVTDADFENKLKTGSVTLYKKDYLGNGLAGAEYKLYNAADNTEVKLLKTGVNEYTAANSGTTGLTLVTNSSGVLKVKNLSFGSYYFSETKAPEGCSLLKQNIPFTISGDNADTLYVSVDVTNVLIPGLPLTGGANAAFVIMFDASIVILCGFVILFAVRRKRKRTNKKSAD